MLRLLAAEALKLRRSLVLLLTVAAPLCVIAFAAIALATRPADVKWERYLDEGLAMWSFFMLPMSVTALTILLAQLEHGSKMWNHLFALPVRRWSLFLTKFAVAVALVIAMQILVYVGLYAVGFAVGRAIPAQHLSGDRQYDDMAWGMARMVVGALPMIAIQLWIALASRGFVLPLIVGILGTFFALVVTASGVTVYLPWLLQIWALLWPKPAGVAALWVGAIGGMAALIVMLAHLSVREPRQA